MSLMLRMSVRMRNAIRRQIENRLENISGLCTGPDAAEMSRQYRPERRRLARMIEALDKATPVRRRA